MATNAAATSPARTVTDTQKVVIVNGTGEMLEMLETLLDAGHYDVVFVEPGEHAYSQVKRVQPNLVVLCMEMNDLEGFRVLSMLKLDEATRQIPVLTYTMELNGEVADDEASDGSDAESLAAAKPALSMN
jgi:PleD family two-component response regulator